VKAARSRPLVVVAGLAVAGLVMLSWTQTWFTVHLDTSAAVVTTVAADGTAVVPQYTALAIASLALFLAMTIAGRVLRVVLALVEVLLGVAVVVTGVSALSDPVASSKGAVGAVAGVSDLAGVRRVVDHVDVGVWPVVGIVAGVLAVLVGVAVLVLQRSWPGPSRKYDDAAGARAGSRQDRPAAVVRDAVVEWDELSAGVDPTVVEADPTSTASGTPGATAGGPADTVDTVGSTERHAPRGATDHEEHREQH
jgi:uncharacterized membrane protein (TIGR02234 family)